MRLSLFVYLLTRILAIKLGSDHIPLLRQGLRIAPLFLVTELHNGHACGPVLRQDSTENFYGASHSPVPNHALHSDSPFENSILRQGGSGWPLNFQSSCSTQAPEYLRIPARATAIPEK